MRKLVRPLAGAGLIALVAGVLTAGFGGVAGASGNPPWEPVGNPPEAGALLFYNATGQQITGGSTTVAPFAAYVEGTTTLVSGDTKATLEAYTPKSGVPAGEWNGEQLGGSTTYPNSGAPAPLDTATLPVYTGASTDTTLATYAMSVYPNTASTGTYAGLYVLRLVTSNPTTSTSYDSADIKISGSTWNVVYPAPTLTTTTTGLSAWPTSSQTFGQQVTLSSTVSPAVPGTVQFEVGGSDIGSPVSETDGTADLSTSTLPLGTDSLSAVFTPAQYLAYSGSTGALSYDVTAISTSTGLSATPSSPQVQGTTEQLTATITPAAAGSVQFKDGTSDIGSPVTVTSGAASIDTSTLPLGSDSLSAVFTSSSPDYTGSTGDLTFDVTAAPGVNTATALTVNPTSVPADTVVTLTAAVTNAGTHAALAAGTGEVKFYDDGTDATGDLNSSSVLVGTVSLAPGGTATFSYYSESTSGAHNVVAEFVPADPAAYNASTSPAVAFTAEAASFAPAAQDLDVDIPAGTLTITTPYSANNPFNLGTATLDAGNGTYTASAPFGSAGDPGAGVTITDTGIGENTWTASVTVTNFTNGGGTDDINGQNLTFTGVTASYLPGNAYGTGTGDIPIDVNDVTNGGTVYAANATGTQGLSGGPHQFAASSAPGAGSVDVYGTLTLVAPSSATPGAYTATLTFTIV